MDLGENESWGAASGAILVACPIEICENRVRGERGGSSGGEGWRQVIRIRIRYHGRMTKVIDRSKPMIQISGREQESSRRQSDKCNRPEAGDTARDVAGAGQKPKVVDHSGGRGRVVIVGSTSRSSRVRRSKEGVKSRFANGVLRRGRGGFEYGKSRTSWLAKRMYEMKEKAGLAKKAQGNGVR